MSSGEPMTYLITVVLIFLSALFSGLTLGLLSLDVHLLERRARHGDTHALTVYPLRRHGNLLLTTLLLGNVAVNTTLSIFLGSIASGLVAGIIATALIVVFGEIIPQSVISRHALYFGAKTAWFTRVALFVLWPVAYPISKVLDYFLGHEIPTIYTKSELMDIVAEHESSHLSDIDNEERQIIQGALKFSHVHVKDAMTPRDNVVMYSEDQKLTEAFFEEINDTGFSRFPIYDDNKDAISGILYAKDLIIEDENITIKQTEEALDKRTLTVESDDLLDTVLVKMLNSKRHIAIVRNEYNRFVGIITLEDIMEEIIQQEIEDEDDD
jgi:metal transporter CNNM